MFSVIRPHFASSAMIAGAPPVQNSSSATQPSTPSAAQTKKIMEQAAYVAACNELELQNLASRGLKNMSALAGTPDPRQLDHFSRAIDIKPGLHSLMSDNCPMHTRNGSPCP